MRTAEELLHEAFTGLLTLEVSVAQECRLNGYVAGHVLPQAQPARVAGADPARAARETAINVEPSRTRERVGGDQFGGVCRLVDLSDLGPGTG